MILWSSKFYDFALEIMIVVTLRPCINREMIFDWFMALSTSWCVYYMLLLCYVSVSDTGGIRKRVTKWQERGWVEFKTVIQLKAT